MGAGIFGAEADFGFAPNFFKDTVGPDNFKFGDSNLIDRDGQRDHRRADRRPARPRHPAVRHGGVGVIRSRFTANTFFNELNTTDFGFNLGGGVMGFFSDNVGLRGDLRYFRSFQDNEPAPTIWISASAISSSGGAMSA